MSTPIVEVKHLSHRYSVAISIFLLKKQEY